MSRLFSVALSLLVAGCGYLGVERQAAAEVDDRTLYATQINASADINAVVELGLGLETVTGLLGEPLATSNEDGQLILVYPSGESVRTGTTVCVVLLPIPFRSKTDGRYRLYFRNDKLERITHLETKSGFYGVYSDDTGIGATAGSKTKCAI